MRFINYADKNRILLALYLRVQRIAYNLLMQTYLDLLRSVTLRRLIVLLLNIRAISLSLSVISGPSF